MNETRMNERQMDTSENGGGGVKGGCNPEDVKKYGKGVIISILAILLFVAAIVYFCVI